MGKKRSFLNISTSPTPPAFPSLHSISAAISNFPREFHNNDDVDARRRVSPSAKWNSPFAFDRSVVSRLDFTNDMINAILTTNV